MSVAVIIQARTGSIRLPGKVLREINGKPMLLWQLERLKRAKSTDAFVVATTDKPEDNPVADLAKAAGYEVFRGSENDVLDRYYQAAKMTKADVVVRITGDCPLHDPEVVDLVVERFLKKDLDYTSTPANFPEGLDTEVFRFSALEAAWKDARLPSEREHVSLFIRNHPERFKVDRSWTVGALDHSTYHWSVDTEQDLRFVEAVYEALYKKGKIFHMNDVIRLVAERPELLEINKGGTGFEGLAKSLQEDEDWKKHDKKI